MGRVGVGEAKSLFSGWWGCGGRKQRRANFNTGAKFIYIYTHTTYKHTYMYAYISRWILT